MSAILKDQFALLEARDSWFGNEAGPVCACCQRRKPDVGEYSDEKTGEQFCEDCGANHTSPCGRNAGEAVALFKKVCAKCARLHTRIPSNAKYMGAAGDLSGWYWECACKSTLFVPESRVA